jgi:hypothetical protein
MKPLDCTMIVEVNYYPDTSFLGEPLKIVFARDNDGLHFVGAFYEVINDDEQCYSLRIPGAIDDLPDDAISIAFSFAWSVCNRFDDEPATERDPVKRGES